MKFNLFYTFKSLIKKPILTVLTILCIVSSTLILAGATNVSDVSIKHFTQQRENIYGNYNISLNSSSDNDNLFYSTARISDYSNYYDEYISFFLSSSTIYNDNTASIVDLMVTDLQTLETLTNIKYKSLGYGDVIISKELATQFNVKLYDYFDVTHFGYTTRLYVSDIIDNQSVFSSNVEMPRIVIDHSTMYDLFPVYNKYIFNVALFKTDDLTLISKLSEEFPHFSCVDLINNLQTTLSLNKINASLALVSIPSLLLCIVICHTVLTYFKKHNEPEFVKLVKIGLEPIEVKKIKFLQTIFISILSLIIFNILLLIVVDKVNAMYGISFAFDAIDYFVFTSFILLLPTFLNVLVQYKEKAIMSLKKQFIINIVIVLLLVLFTLLVNKYTIVPLITFSFALVVTIPLLLKTIVYQFIKKKEVFLVFLTKIEKCSITFILTLGLLISFVFANYFEFSNDTNILLSDTNDITISVSDSEFDYKTLLNDYNGFYYYDKTNIHINDTELYKLYGVDDVVDIQEVFNLEMNDLTLNSNEIIISSFYYDNYNVEVGDLVSVRINNIEVELEVSGFIKSTAHNSMFSFINMDTLRDSFQISNYNKIILKDSITSYNDVLKILASEGINIRMHSGFTTYYLNHHNSMSLVSLIMFFIILIVVFELIFVLLLRFNDMNNNFRIVKMIGCSDKKIILNSIVLSLIKLIICILSSIIIYYFIGYLYSVYFNYQNCYIPYNLNACINIYSTILIVGYIVIEMCYTTYHFKKFKI